MKVGNLIEILQNYSPKRNVGITISGSRYGIEVMGAAGASSDIIVDYDKDAKTVWLCGVNGDLEMWLTEDEFSADEEPEKSN